MKADRIYVIVPRILETPEGPVLMPAGRMAAQVGHCIGKLTKTFKRAHAMATLVLEVNASRDLEAAQDFLKEMEIPFIIDRDDFPPYVFDRVVQAIATEPLTKNQANVLSGFRLWS